LFLLTEGTGDQSDPHYTFTVFTPTYNRAHTLHRVYRSLCAQTFRDFEWLVVDDGSDDATRTVVEAWQLEAWFPIRYVFQEHKGKHRAFNWGVAHARGDFFLTLDSDDACVPEALERLKYHWESIPESERSHFSAVTALCVDERGRLIGTKFPFNPTDSDSLEIRYKFHVKGEKWGFHRTATLRRFPFPVIEGHQGLVPESTVWNAIAHEFKTRYVNEPLFIYYPNKKGASLSRPSNMAEQAPGRLLAYEALLNSEITWLRHAPRRFLLTAAQYSRCSLHSGRRIQQQVSALDNFRARLLWAVAFPLGLSCYLADKAGLGGYLPRGR
jgi:glycosyltransferase involved in cell wall biosynthesis